MSTATCYHVVLNRQNSGSYSWYICHACGQKFLVRPWDGKLTPVFPKEQPDAEQPEP